MTSRRTSISPTTAWKPRNRRRGACEISTSPTSAARCRPDSSATRSTRPSSSGSTSSTSAMPHWCSVGSTVVPSNRRPWHRPDRGGTESFHIGRLAIADQNSEPVVVDWRAPGGRAVLPGDGPRADGLAASPSLRRRGRVDPRHRGRVVRRRTSRHRPRRRAQRGSKPPAPDCAATRRCSPPSNAAAPERSATSSPRSRRSRTRSSVRRSPACSSSRADPGTGKTVVALHRAAYLLYTHRFPLEDQGVLVIGPNRVFLRYIERVLPSLGEAGVEQVVLADLVPNVRFAGATTPRRAGTDAPDQGRRTDVDADRPGGRRPRAAAARGPGGPVPSRLPAPHRRGVGTHRQGRLPSLPAPQHRPPPRRRRVLRRPRRLVAIGEVSGGELRQELRGVPEVRAALERMWPVLTPAQLLHDLFGSASVAAPRRSQRVRRGRAGGALPTTVRRCRRRALGRRRRRPPRRRPRGARSGAQPQRPDQRVRRDPHVRPHRRRRGPGSLADAAEDDHPAVAERLADGRRRPRPGHRTVGAVELERCHGSPAGPSAQPGDRVVRRLSHPGPDHAARRRSDACRDAGPAGPEIGARRRRRRPEIVTVASPRRARERGGRGGRRR